MKRKFCTNATLTEQTGEKQTKSLKTLRKILFLLIALFPVKVAEAASARLSYHTSQFSIIPTFRLGGVLNNSTEDPQCNNDHLH